MRKVYGIQYLLAINKVLWESSHGHYVSILSVAARAALSNCDRDCMAHRAKKIYYLGLHRTSFLTCGLEQR